MFYLIKYKRKTCVISSLKIHIAPLIDNSPLTCSLPPMFCSAECQVTDQLKQVPTRKQADSK